MGKVYSPPEEVGGFNFDFANFDMTRYEAEEAAYLDKLRTYCRVHGKGDYAGTEIRFQVADGFARYMVLSLSPVVLIHVPTGDAWQYQYANRLTAKDIRTEADRIRKSDAFWARQATQIK